MRGKKATLLAALAFLVWAGETAGAGAAATYIVQPGDTLYSLARRLGTTVGALVELNGIGPEYLIRVGQRLTLPGDPAGAAGKQAPAGAEQNPAEGRVYAAVRPAAELEGEWAGDRGVLVAGPPASAPVPVGPATVAPPPPAGAASQTAPAGDSPARFAPGDGVIPYSEEERLLLARLVVAEAGNEPLEGQVAVAAVVVNRVRHQGFPKTITGVIQEPGQFKTIELGRVEAVTPSAATLAAVDRALAGEDPTHGALFFYNPAKSVAMDFWRTRPVTAVIGGHNFAR